MTELQRLAIEHGLHASPRVLEAFANRVADRTRAKCLGVCTEFTRNATDADQIQVARKIMDGIKRT